MLDEYSDKNSALSAIISHSFFDLYRYIYRLIYIFYIYIYNVRPVIYIHQIRYSPLLTLYSVRTVRTWPLSAKTLYSSSSLSLLNFH
jgi:hypothetical protein